MWRLNAMTPKWTHRRIERRDLRVRVAEGLALLGVRHRDPDVHPDRQEDEAREGGSARHPREHVEVRQVREEEAEAPRAHLAEEGEVEDPVQAREQERGRGERARPRVEHLRGAHAARSRGRYGGSEGGGEELEEEDEPEDDAAGARVGFRARRVRERRLRGDGVLDAMCPGTRDQREECRGAERDRGERRPQVGDGEVSDRTRAQEEPDEVHEERAEEHEPPRSRDLRRALAAERHPVEDRRQQVGGGQEDRDRMEGGVHAVDPRSRTSRATARPRAITCSTETPAT
jgi:hypothetical protein